MAAQAQVQVDGQVVSVVMSPKVSKRGTQGYWGNARIKTPGGQAYVVQVSAWLCGSGNGGNGSK
jgi:hypothetical protein